MKMKDELKFHNTRISNDNTAEHGSHYFDLNGL